MDIRRIRIIVLHGYLPTCLSFVPLPPNTTFLGYPFMSLSQPLDILVHMGNFLGPLNATIL